MASIDYNSIYSRFYSKVEAYDFLDLSNEQINDFLCSWLHSSVSSPYVRELFSTLTFDDDVMRLTYELKYPFDEGLGDEDFVIELLATGICIEWMTPKVQSVLNTAAFYGSKEEKVVKTSLKLLRADLTQMKKEQRRMISDRGYIRNRYTDGSIALTRES